MFTHTLSKREKKTARTKHRIKIKAKLNGQPLWLSVNLISHTVGRGLAPAEIINGYMITNGCYQIKFNIIP